MCRDAYLVGSPSGDQHRVPQELEEGPAAHPTLLPQPPPQRDVQVAAGGVRGGRPLLPLVLARLQRGGGEQSRGVGGAWG